MLWGILLFCGALMKRIFLFSMILFLGVDFLLPVMGEGRPFQWRRGSVSQQNLLQHAPFHWVNGKISRRISPEKSPFPDTLQILVIRVEFQIDEDESTTGNGTFDLSVPAGPTLDPPPHDRAYFVRQMEALSNYYYSVSGGKLVLLPDVLDTVFTLPYEMAHYNPATTEEAMDRGLSELFRDAVLCADSAGIRFSEYNCFLVFHAGVGRDIDLDYDPTPSDISSAFLSLKDFRKHFGGGDPLYQGIAVEGGTYPVPDGILLPETESQEGIEIGLLGTTALMFGFQLGLPALWSTKTGRSGIGRWGLMDHGSGNFRGLIPAEPCAWSKVFLGWETPVDTLRGDSVKVACSKAECAPKIYRIPINDHEYFLIENRVRDPNNDGVTKGWTSEGDSVIFKNNGEMVFPPSLGVIVRVEEYDFGLPYGLLPPYTRPGSGILIWHIDEKVIEENLESNSINADKERRGVDLEEADGAQDIGEVYGFLDPAYGSETGNFFDAWFGDNEIAMLVNKSEEVAFTPDTHPSSRSNSGANSHIVISHFSTVDTVMHFRVSTDLIMEGYPKDFGMGGNPYPPLFGDLDGDGKKDIAVVTEEGKVYAWKGSGTPLLSNQVTGYRVSVSGDTTRFPVALFADADEEVTAALVVGDLNDDGRDDVAVATVGGRVLGWTGMDSDGDGLADEILHWTGGIGRVTTLLFRQGASTRWIVAGTEDGEVLALTPEGDVLWNGPLESGFVAGMCLYGSGLEDSLVVTTGGGVIALIGPLGNVLQKRTLLPGESLTSPSVAYLVPDPSPSVVVFGRDGSGFILNGDLSEKARFGDRLPEGVSNPALGDVDGDGFMEIVVTAGGQVWCFNHNGSTANDFPVPFYPRNIGLSDPILGDVDGDGYVDIVAVSSQGNVEAYRYDGRVVEGFPLTTGGSQRISPTLLDLDDDGKIEMAAVSEQGFLFGWNFSGTYSLESVPWGSCFHDPAHTGIHRQRLQPEAPSGDWMPSSLVYNYPNPTGGNYTTIRYRLEQPAKVWITIYNLAGEQVDSFPGPGEAQTENEAIWWLAKVESGVYFCQVKAVGNGLEKAVTFKIAVVK